MAYCKRQLKRWGHDDFHAALERVATTTSTSWMGEVTSVSSESTTNKPACCYKFSESTTTSYPTTMSMSSSESIANNEDLLTQILLHLPLKTLSRFKSVSPRWLSLLSTSPQLSSPIPTNALLLQQSDHLHNLDLLPLDASTTRSFPFRSLPFFPQRSLLTISSCNGLLLCYENNNPNVTYYVYNPTTSRHTTLPSLPQASSPWNFSSYLAFEPSISPYYKVASLRMFHAHSTSQVVIYSSQTRSWRVHGFPSKVNPRDVFHLRKGAFWNGAIHWISHKDSFRLDMTQEKVLESPTIPITRFSESHFDYFGVSWGRLYLIYCSDNDHKELDVYEMERDFSSWTLRYKVEIGHELATSFPEMVRRNGGYCDYRVPYFAPQSSIDDEPYVVLQIRTQLVCYYFRSGSVRKIYDLPINYSNSVSIHGGGRRELPLSGASQYIENPFRV